ncbi:MAG: hypothetical protein WC009_13000 [Methylotenera sp.]
MARILIFLFLFLLAGLTQANSRQPCDRGAGGISHCDGIKFICNDGRVSKSKKICTGYDKKSDKQRNRLKPEAETQHNAAEIAR